MRHSILSGQTMYNGHVFSVDLLRVRLPDQRERDYDLVRHPDSVTILPLDRDGGIWFVTQFRVGSNSVLLELPAGVLDEGEQPEACAAREIREETGLAARSLRHLGSNYLAPGYCSELNHVYLATDLVSSPLQMDDDEFLNTRKVYADEIEELIASGDLQDSKSLAALFLAQPYLEK
jgi:ADP-ribose pyrophosphatase